MHSLCSLFATTEAAEIAIDLMLQEELSHPVCHALSQYACHLRLGELLSSSESAVEDAATKPDDDDVSDLS